MTDKTEWTDMDQILVDPDIIPLLPPKREDFCYIIKEFDGSITTGCMPARPVHLKDSGINLAHYHCTAVEHICDLYRLYRYGEKAKGVFRGGEIVVESIPIQDEFDSFSCMLISNENAYKQANKDWRSYWEWMANRNDARWVDQEVGDLDYDQKNMMHTVRLMWSGENFLRHGEPIVRFTGEKLQFLRDIRTGKFAYDYLLKLTADKMMEMRQLYDNCKLPHSPNTKRINELYVELVNM